MTDPIIIERSELANIARNAVFLTLKELGIKKGLNPWISQNEAFRLVSRRRIENAISEGRVKFYKKDFNKRCSRIYIKRTDVEKLINNP